MLSGFGCLVIVVALVVILMPADVKKDETKRKGYIQFWTLVITAIVVASVLGGR